jgi:hypothetical protein
VNTHLKIASLPQLCNYGTTITFTMTFKLALFLVWVLAASEGFSQSIYIDQVPGYGSMPCCAQIPVSIIVRDMSNGCGDNTALTSYKCFCTSSSSYFSSLISTEVLAQCLGNSTDASQAVDVFSSYCAVGVTGTQATLTC